MYQSKYKNCVRHLAVSLRSDFLSYATPLMSSASHVVSQTVLAQHDPVTRVVALIRAAVTVSTEKYRDLEKV